MQNIQEFLIEEDSLNKLYQDINLFYDLNINLYPGEFCSITSSTNEKSKIILFNTSSGIKRADTYKNKNLSSFYPKDLKQMMYFNMLDEESFEVIVSLGAAGTGKTTIAMAKAAERLFKEKKKIYLCKPTLMVQSHENHVFGPVPGDVNEKYAPYISSFEIVLSKVLGSKAKSYVEAMFQKKKIEFIPVEFTRGCTFDDCTFILDEVQNLTWHELKTVLSRIGDNSKIILCGDPNQIDARFDYPDSGLYKLIHSENFQRSDFTSQILLTKQYRGKIPDLIYHIDKE